MKLYYSKYMWCVALCVDLSFKLIHTYNLHIIWNDEKKKCSFVKLFQNTKKNVWVAVYAIAFDAFMRECNSDKPHTLYTQRIAFNRVPSISLIHFLSHFCISLSCVGTYIRWCDSCVQWHLLSIEHADLYEKKLNTEKQQQHTSALTAFFVCLIIVEERTV